MVRQCAIASGPVYAFTIFHFVVHTRFIFSPFVSETSSVSPFLNGHTYALHAQTASEKGVKEKRSLSLSL